MLLATVAPPGRRALVWVTGALISAGAVTYILYTASEEPFFFMSTGTLVILEALGLIFAVLLGIWTKAAVAAAQRLAASKLRALLSAAAISWTLLCTCYLGVSMLSCLQDYRRFRTVQPGILDSVDSVPSPGP
jgi:hypothetical protein